ncbi:MAG: DEAD/DEAH box helicase [Myxococcota bacterium]
MSGLAGAPARRSPFRFALERLLHGMQFDDLALSPALLKNLAHFEKPTPVQEAAIPPALAGHDVIAIAQTGTGKTAAFVLPLLQRLMATRRQGPSVPRALILSPMRELASQIGESIALFGRDTRVQHEVIFGGVGEEKQKRALRAGTDIIVATPGRLLDLMSQRAVDFSSLEVLILDEADRMLDMGFLPDVKRVINQLPVQRQTLLFSATMPDDIAALAARILQRPVRIEVTPPSTTVERIAQSIYFVEKDHKRSLLLHLLKDAEVRKVLVFTRTKHGANRVAETLVKAGVTAAAIHGNKSQGARERALEGFKTDKLRALVATDLAGRGIDIEGVSHVIQVDLPEVPEQYVHRIGRTARAGREGVAWAFCATDEKPLLRDIERTIRLKIEVKHHPYAGATTPGQDWDGGRREPQRPAPTQRRGGGGARRETAETGGPRRRDHGRRPQEDSAGRGPRGEGSQASPEANKGAPRGRSFRPGRR